MLRTATRLRCALLMGSVFIVSAAWGVTPAEKCEAAKNKIAGKYAFCRQKAVAKAVKVGGLPDYSKCDPKFSDKWAIAEGGGGCPTTGDEPGIKFRVSANADLIALKLTGVRFVANGNGTVTDLYTGLMWEQKTTAVGSGVNLADPHDVDNLYSWSTGANKPNGTAFTDFLGALNDGTSPDQVATSGCFAGHCDWRLPTIEELNGIVDATQGNCSGGSGPCIDPLFGPTQTDYWSVTTETSGPSLAWFAGFDIGELGGGDSAKTNPDYVRAVRGGS